MSVATEVLHVENDRLVARALRRALRGCGYHVHSLYNCCDTRAEVQAGRNWSDNKNRYTLGVFDIDLGDGDGIALASELLDRSAVRAAIFYSGTQNIAAQDRARLVGELVAKHEGLSALHTAIARQLPVCIRGRLPTAARERQAPSKSLTRVVRVHRDGIEAPRVAVLSR